MKNIIQGIKEYKAVSNAMQYDVEYNIPCLGFRLGFSKMRGLLEPLWRDGLPWGRSDGLFDARLPSYQRFWGHLR